MNDVPSTNARKRKDIQQMLSRVPWVTGACELDLLVFFYRHPRSLLTNEQLAALVGYDTKEIAKSIDAFVDAGFLERAQTPIHAARMYLLVLEGPQTGGLKELLNLATTLQWRRDILEVLVAGPSGLSARRAKRRLRVVA